MAPLVATLDRPHLTLAVARVNAQDPSEPVTVFLPGGQVLGRPGPAVAGRPAGRARAELHPAAPGGVEILVAVQGLPGGTAVIRTFVPDARLTSGVLHAWLLLGAHRRSACSG